MVLPVYTYLLVDFEWLFSKGWMYWSAEMSFGPQELNGNQSEPQAGRGGVLPCLDDLLQFQSVEFTSRFKDKSWWGVVWILMEAGLDHLQLKFFFISLAHKFVFPLSYANTPPQTCKNNSLCLYCLLCLFHSHRSTSRQSANLKSQCLRTITWPTHQWSIGSSSRAEAGTWVSTKRVKSWRAIMLRRPSRLHTSSPNLSKVRLSVPCTDRQADSFLKISSLDWGYIGWL